MTALTPQAGIDYSAVAENYDRSRRAEPAIATSLCDALDAIGARTVLEIGAGTGNYTAAIAARGFEITAGDRSAPMIDRGRAKARARWMIFDALNLPFKDGCVDAAVGVNVLHHLGEPAAALAELRRVVRTGAVLQAVVRENLATLWYRHYFPEIDRILMPIHPPLGALIGAFLRAGFDSVTAAPVLYSGRADLTFESASSRPELLFDAGFRAATSGFRRLGARAVERGLAALAEDLRSGRFAGIRARFESDHAAAGDCAILRARI
jgi:SAM-dependent methyltransferase